MNEHEAAWVAGFIDGEGTIAFWNQRSKHPESNWIIEVAAGNTHTVTIERLKMLAGCGRVQVLNKYPHQTLYLWKATSKAAEKFLERIRPYSVTKATQIDLALSGVRLRREAPREKKRITKDTHAKLRLIHDAIKAEKVAG